MAKEVIGRLLLGGGPMIELDDDGLTLEQLFEVRRLIHEGRAAELAKAPGFRDQIEERYGAEEEQINAAIEEGLADLQYLAYWQERVAEDGPAAEVMALMLEAKDDSEVFAVVKNLTDRFVAVANPPAEPEPEAADLVADIDPNNPMRRTPPAIRRQAERDKDPSTHSRPLGELRPDTGPPRIVRETAFRRYRQAPMRVVTPADIQTRGEDTDV